MFKKSILHRCHSLNQKAVRLENYKNAELFVTTTAKILRIKTEA